MSVLGHQHDKLDREAGVDLLRAAAILMVVAYHVIQMSPHSLPGAMQLARFGQYGVDLFFVLSGWLIGGLYWKERSRFGDVELGRFWWRRWLRTIPPYLAVLPIAWLSVWVARKEPFNWGYLVFLQNYYAEVPFYVVSWSLCIEEHFYLFMPLLLLVTLRLGKILRLGNIPVNGLFLLLVGFAPAGRWWLSLDGLDPRFGREWTATHLRMEGLLIGFWLAWALASHPGLWARLLRAAPALAAGGAAVFAWSELSGPVQVYRIGLTALAVLWAGLLLLMVSGRCPRVASSPWVKAVALSSYSVYLTHSLMIHLARLIMEKAPGLHWLAYFPLSLMVVAAGGAFFYFFVERSSIRLRDRWVPRRISVTAAPTSQ